jgi:hypothetical protein
VNDDGASPPRATPGAIATVVILVGVTALAFFGMSLAAFGLATGCTTELDCGSAEWSCSPCDGVRRAWYAWLVLQGGLLVGAAAWTLTRERRGMAIGAYVLLSGALLFGAIASAS